jgi:hypothetical protein
MTLQWNLKKLPWALPAIVFLFDFVDFQWMFSHEPGLTEGVVRRFQLLLLPGILFAAPVGAVIINCGLAALVGTVAVLVFRPKS